MYREHLRKQLSDDEKGDWTFIHHKHEAIELFMRSGLEDGSFAFAEPIGLMQMTKGHASIFANMDSLRKDVVQHVIHYFEESDGIYSHRIRNTLNPIWWIEAIIYTPAHLVSYLGLSKISWIGKAANVSTWIAAVGGFIFSDAGQQAHKWFEGIFS